MRKAEKRRIGREKFEKDMAEEKDKGLRLQEQSKKKAAEELQAILGQRDVSNRKHVENKVAKAQAKRDNSAFDINLEDLIDRTDEDAGEMEFGCGIGA